MRRIKEAGKGRVGVTGAASVGDAYAAKTDSAFDPMDLNTIAFTADIAHHHPASQSPSTIFARFQNWGL